jgi:hypothetical protein
MELRQYGNFQSLWLPNNGINLTSPLSRPLRSKARANPGKPGPGIQVMLTVI